MASHSLLLVDDEPNITKSLKRVLEDDDYQIYTSDDGNKGLEILKNQPISVVISDQRMPRMSGSQFLQKVREQYPQTIRILMTGSADIKAVVSAINHGQIYQYVSKPWVDEDLKIVVRQAVEQYELIQENKRLQEITSRQNEELKNNNLRLEEEVKRRTGQLDKLYQEVKQNFIEFIRVFLQLISTFDSKLGEHCKRVAVVAKLVGQKMSITGPELEQLEIAALLHDIGLISIPKAVSQRPFYLLSEKEQELFKQHPIIGQSMLSTVKNLQEVGLIIRSHHEQYDGQGYPDGLKGEEISKAAHIVRVADEFDRLKQLVVKGEHLSNQKCINYLKKYRGSLLHPEVVDCLCVAIQGLHAKPKNEEIYLLIEKLKPGLKLSRPIRTKNGAIFMHPDTILQQEDIDSLTSLKQIKAIPDSVYIHKL